MRDHSDFPNEIVFSNYKYLNTHFKSKFIHMNQSMVEIVFYVLSFQIANSISPLSEIEIPENLSLSYLWKCYRIIKSKLNREPLLQDLLKKNYVNKL